MESKIQMELDLIETLKYKKNELIKEINDHFNDRESSKIVKGIIAACLENKVIKINSLEEQLLNQTICLDLDKFQKELNDV